MARITVPTVENLMNELGLIFQKTYSNDFKVDKRSQWYMFMFPIVYLLTLKIQGVQSALDQNNIWKAEDVNLDDLLAGNFNFRRKNASYSKVKVKVRGTVGTNLNIGDLVIQSTNDVNFILNESGVIGSSGEVTLKFISNIPGVVGNKEEVELIKYLSTKNGVYSFDTFENATGGADTETDNEYRARWFISNKSSEWNINGIYSEVLNVDGVTDVYVDENVEPISQNGLSPKSVVVVVSGGRNEEIAEAIFKKVDHSIETIGNVEVYVNDIQNIPRRVRFYRPTTTNIEYTISYVVADSQVVDVNDLKILVENYLKGLKLGSYITSDECNKSFIRPAFGTDKILNIDIKFRKSGVGTFENFIKLNFNEVANGIYTV